MTVKERIHFLIESSSDLAFVSEKLNELFAFETKRLKIKKYVKITLRSSKDVMLKEYGEPLNYRQSESTIEISLLEEKYHLFLADKNWVLDDEIYNNDHIAEKLVEIKCIKQPSGLYELKRYLIDELFEFNQSLPSFSDKKLNKDYDVLSWDDTNVLIGTNENNLEIITQIEWDGILKRSKEI